MKRKKLLTRGISLVSILVLVSMVFLGAWNRESIAAAPEAKKLQIGILACVTNWFTAHDLPDVNEALITADIINEKGGITIKGEKYQIELILEDGKSSLDGITAAANRLVYDKKVKFIIGPAAFFNSAAAPITNPNKVITVMSFATNQPGEMDKSTPYTFAGFNASVGEALASINFIKKHLPKVKKLVLVIPDDGAIPYLTPILKKYFATHGFSMVGDTIGYANETVDFNPIAAKINALKGADAVFHQNGIGPQLGNIVKGLRDLGNRMPYVAVIPSDLSESVTIAGKEACKDVYCCAVSVNDPGNPPVMNEICKRTIAKYGPGTSLFLQLANALWSLKEAITAAQSLDPTLVKAKWESMSKIDTLFGPGTMGGEQTYGIKNHAVAHPQPFQGLKDGMVVPIGFYDPGVIP
jgi:branched-chain amino acid transport system substrate-binding protein